MISLDFDGAQEATKKAVMSGIPSIKIIDSLRAGLSIVGDRFERSEYFLSELVVAGEIAKDVMKIIELYIRREEIKSKGKVVIATVYGDIHDIGKNIVGTLLIAEGFDIVDLGIDVSSEDIVEVIREHKP